MPVRKFGEVEIKKDLNELLVTLSRAAGQFHPPRANPDMNMPVIIFPDDDVTMDIVHIITEAVTRRCYSVETWFAGHTPGFDLTGLMKENRGRLKLAKSSK